jgi:hypothetical protein
MAAPLATNVNVKQEEPDPNPGLCLICTLPIRIPGEEPDALLCSQCGVVYHRVCAPDWTSECYQCLGKEAVSNWTSSLPPEPGVGSTHIEEDVAAARKRRLRERLARQPPHRCGVFGCNFQTKQKHHLKRHQACVHGIGDVDAEALNRKQREYEARRPVQRCSVDGCGFNTKHKHNLRNHQARVHGIGDVDAVEELSRKKREVTARQPAHRCGVNGCKYQTKQKHHLEQHHARVHGIGDVNAEELRRKQRERLARQPLQTCGVDGCEFLSNHKGNLERHHARAHGIGGVASEVLTWKRRATRPKRSDAMDFDADIDTVEDAVVAAAPRSRRNRSAIDYAALAGGNSDDSDANDEAT